MRVELHVFTWRRLADFGALAAVLRAHPAESIRELVVLGKTEGPATLNDFSREVATGAAQAAVLAAGGPALLARTTCLFSTGCEGLASPFGMALVVLEESNATTTAPRLALATARTAEVPYAGRGGAAHARHVAAGVRAAMARAGLTAAQVGLVLVKSPVLPAGAAEDSRAGSTGAARAAGALGAALALGEITDAALDAAGPLARAALHGSRAMAFSGTELDHDEIVVLGNRPGAGGNLTIHATGLADALDVGAMRRLAARLGARWNEDGVMQDPSPLRAMFLKLGTPPGGMLRGRRTTILGSELTPDKHLRAAASGVAGALFGAADIFVSGGAEGQAPAGGGLFATIAEAGAA
ncbi:MAG: ring-opening amidohydrolase [Roseomonas sp.]|nr:ring-opening amidohydrolase [Roseomonas sp.]